MENFLTPDLKRLLIIFGVGFVSLSCVTGYIISKVRGAFKPFARSTMLYMLCYGIGFGLVSLCTNISFDSVSLLFIVFQSAFLLLGILHLVTIKKYNKWSTDESFWLNLLFTFVISLVGTLFFIVVYRIFNKDGLDMYMALAGLFFMVPLLVWQTYLKAIEIAPKIYKLWYYPVQHRAEFIPDDSKLKNFLIISFEFKKKEEDDYYTNFRAKAPVDMEAGELFYYFLNDYNIRHSKSKINYIDNKSGQPYGWIFYKKPKWYTIFTKYIDMDKTVFINNIRENDIIVCNRETY